MIHSIGNFHLTRTQFAVIGIALMIICIIAVTILANNPALASEISDSVEIAIRDRRQGTGWAYS